MWGTYDEWDALSCERESRTNRGGGDASLEVRAFGNEDETIGRREIIRGQQDLEVESNEEEPGYGRIVPPIGCKADLILHMPDGRDEDADGVFSSVCDGQVAMLPRSLSVVSVVSKALIVCETGNGKRVGR